MKLIMMKGLPACGKSTIARGMIKANGNTVRLDLDHIRKMLNFGEMTESKEEKAARAMETLATDCLMFDNDVIIDGVNMEPKIEKKWKSFAKKKGFHFEVNDMTDIPVGDCIDRDKKREKQAGGIFIKNMAIRYGLKKFKKNSVVICDIDGTISDTSNRTHYIEKPKEATKNWKKDWNSFFREMIHDPVREDIKKLLLQFHKEGKTVIFMTARPEMYRDVTVRWLQSHFLSFFDTIIMRRIQDKRTDSVVKKELLNKYFPDKEVIHIALDDRPRVIRMFNEEGIHTLSCGTGKEF